MSESRAELREAVVCGSATGFARYARHEQRPFDALTVKLRRSKIRATDCAGCALPALNRAP